MKKTLITMICAALSVVSSYADSTPHDLSGGNFSQNWSVDLFSADDDWSGVPSIIGYRGDGLASSGTDPQTVVADGSATPVNVINNSSSTSSTGGIHDLSTDVVALQGSGTADAPHLVIFLDAAGRENVQISYNLTEEDTSNAVQQVALQYRVGSSGNFTNIPAGYVADAANGSFQVTPVSVTLPSAVNDESVVEVRIITADASGSDSMIGVDDIVVTSSAIPGPTSSNSINLFQSIPIGVGSGEVVSHSKVGSDYFIAVTDNPNGGVSIYKWIDANQKYVFDRHIDIASQVTNFAEVSSVALDPRGTGLGAAVAQVDDPAINTTGNLSIPQIGQIVFFDVTDGSIEGQTTTGYHPDMVTFGSTGICAVANEGEYAWATDSKNELPASHQPGSVSLYDLTGVTVGSFTPAASVSEVNIDFSTATLTGVRYGVAESIEPEYVSFLPSGDALFVGAQENNTLFYLGDLANILASSTTPNWEVYPLGTVQYQTDASDKDGIDISDFIKGMHMPDAIAVFEQGGSTYIITADEGDARPNDSDIKRAGKFAANEDNLVAATPVYDADGPGPNGPLNQTDFNALLENDNELGRIDVIIDQSTVAGELTDIVGLGSRGVSVWEYDDSVPSLTRVSHLPLESFLATEDPDRHNSNGGGDPSKQDKRSDNKGPEPEAVSVVNIGGTNYALVGCERQNGLVLVDLSDPANPSAVSYINNRDASLISPETATIITAADSPTGSILAVVGYEGIANDSVTGGIGIYNLEETDAFTLTILHNNDGESQLFDYEGDTNYGSIARFKTAVDAHRSFYQSIGHGVIAVFAGDSFLAGPEFQASLESGAPGARSFYDALALSQIGYDAFAIGNHEFDFGPDVLAEFIGDAQTTNPVPFLSANLDFTTEPDMLTQETAGNVATSAIINVPTANGVKQVGVIGATTENLPFISSPRDTIINTVASSVNTEITALQLAGVDAIILVSHLQGLSEDVDLIPSLNAGIDLIVAGGGDELIGNQTASSPRSIYGSSAPASVIDTGLFSSDSYFDADSTPATTDEYPFISTNTDVGGNTIPIVTGAGNYGYLGRVTLNFDGLGGITVDSTSNPALILDTSISATDGYDQDSDIVSTIAPVQTFVTNLASNIIGYTSVELPQSSNLVRSDEQAVGNLVADAYLAKAQALAASFSVDVPQVALVNGGGIRSNIPVGDISELTTFNVSPFGNFVAVVADVSSADFRLLLENAYSRTVDNDPTVGVDPLRQGGGTGRFAQVSGVSVVYDISNTAMALDSVTETISIPGSRVISAVLDDGTEVIVNGNPVPGVTVDIAMPFFSANGGDQWFRYATGGTSYTSVDYPVVPLIGNTDQQALEDYIVSLTTSSTPGSELDADNRYDLTKDGRIITISDVDNDRVDDRVEDKLGTDVNVADVTNPVNVIAAVTSLETAANAAGEAAGITTGQNNVINDPISYYSDIIAANPSQTQAIRVNTVIGLVNNPGTTGGTIDLDIDILSGSSPDNLDTILDSMTVTGLEAEANKLFYEADAAAGSVSP